MSHLYAMIVKWGGAKRDQRRNGGWRCFIGWHDFPYRWKRLEPDTCKCRRCDTPYMKGA